MAFTIPKENYNGKVYEVELGVGERAIKIGGESTLPFLSFEGEMPNRPSIAIEIQDLPPSDWPDTVKKVYEKVSGNPVTWAKYCQDELKADAVALRLISTHPDQKDTKPEDAAKLVSEVLNAISIPVIILGSEHIEKDIQVLKTVAETAKGKNCIIGKAQEENHKRIAALLQNDGAMQPPLVCDIGKNVWKTKETIAAETELPEWGSLEERGIIWEAMTAAGMIMAGANLLIMRHPRAIDLTKKLIE